MSTIGPVSSRSTTLLTGDQLLAAIRRTQLELNEQQNAITTGEIVNKPSDSPSKTPAIQQLQQSLEAREQHDQNLQHALGVLNNADVALADTTDIVLEAVSIASSQIGPGTNPQTRANQAVVIDQQFNALTSIANRQFQSVSLFGGSTTVGKDQPVFVSHLGGLRYIGSRTNLEADVGLAQPLAFNSNGDEAFGALSARVISQVDLDPQATANTRLDDVNGALGEGVRRGETVVVVDGNSSTVSVVDAETLGDVVVRINDAINNIDPTAGSLAINGSGFELTANAGHSIQISEQGVGMTAADLGVVLNATGNAVAGNDVDPRLTVLTELSALGATIDFAGGLKISQGGLAKIADLSSATTVQDLINVMNQLDMGVRMEINDDGTAVDLVNEISALNLSIGENAGGTTAEDLGLRSFGRNTQFDDFRFGLGVSSEAGEQDFEIRLHDGTTFQVNIDGIGVVDELINEIAAQAAAVGLTVGNPGDAGAVFNVGLALDGNGFQFEDNTVGAGNFQVVQLGLSQSASDLGINASVGGGNVIIGNDNAEVRVESVFTHLRLLRDALTSNNERGITFAGGFLETDLNTSTQARADVAVRSKQVQDQQERSATLKLAEQIMLSNLQDADLTEVITRFTQLMQQLEGSLAFGAQNLRLSLLDFLR